VLCCAVLCCAVLCCAVLRCGALLGCWVKQGLSRLLCRRISGTTTTMRSRYVPNARTAKA
jgi:hypothetical protein